MGFDQSLKALAEKLVDIRVEKFEAEYDELDERQRIVTIAHTGFLAFNSNYRANFYKGKILFTIQKIQIEVSL